jgi:hypothetical protein
LKFPNDFILLVSTIQVVLFGTWIYCVQVSETVAARAELYSQIVYSPTGITFFEIAITLASFFFLNKFKEKMNKSFWFFLFFVKSFSHELVGFMV